MFSTNEKTTVVETRCPLTGIGDVESDSIDLKEVTTWAPDLFEGWCQGKEAKLVRVSIVTSYASWRLFLKKGDEATSVGCFTIQSDGRCRSWQHLIEGRLIGSMRQGKWKR